MLHADSTRELNQAARVIEKFLNEQKVTLSHAKALKLVARLIGKSTHMAAQADMPNLGLLQPKSLRSYADLLRALNLLTPEQLAMSITVTEGCDSNGNAEFYPACEFLRADDTSMQAGADGVLDDCQPLLVFNNDNSSDDESDLDDEPYSDDVSKTGALQPDASAAASVINDLCKVLLSPDVALQLSQLGIVDASWDALAQAAPHLTDDVFNRLPQDALTRAYDNLPTTVSLKDFANGNGNWGLSESDFLLVRRIADALGQRATGTKLDCS